jgi:hypothetical protein
MQPAIQKYMNVAVELFGEQLRSLTLFGALAAGRFNPQRDTARSVLVTARVDLEAIRRFAEYGPELGKSSIAAPLMMTPAYVEESRDTFPLELLDIHQNHLVLIGDDFFAELQFADADIRLQCERELKTILLGMRQGLLAASGHAEELAALVRSVGDALLRTMRGMLWIREQRDSRASAEVIAATEKLIDHPLKGISAALQPDAIHGWNQFVSMYEEVQKLSEVVNAW